MIKINQADKLSILKPTSLLCRCDNTKLPVCGSPVNASTDGMEVTKALIMTVIIDTRALFLLGTIAMPIIPAIKTNKVSNVKTERSIPKVKIRNVKYLSAKLSTKI